MTKPSNFSYVWIATYPKGMQVAVRSRREVMPNAIDLGTWKLQTIDGPRFYPSSQLIKLLPITGARTAAGVFRRFGDCAGDRGSLSLSLGSHGSLSGRCFRFNSRNIIGPPEKPDTHGDHDGGHQNHLA